MTDDWPIYLFLWLIMWAGGYAFARVTEGRRMNDWLKSWIDRWMQ